MPKDPSILSHWANKSEHLVNLKVFSVSVLQVSDHSPISGKSSPTEARFGSVSEFSWVVKAVRNRFVIEMRDLLMNEWNAWSFLEWPCKAR